MSDFPPAAWTRTGSAPSSLSAAGEKEGVGLRMGGGAANPPPPPPPPSHPPPQPAARVSSVRDIEELRAQLEQRHRSFAEALGAVEAAAMRESARSGSSREGGTSGSPLLSRGGARVGAAGSATAASASRVGAGGAGGAAPLPYSPDIHTPDIARNLRPELSAVNAAAAKGGDGDGDGDDDDDGDPVLVRRKQPPHNSQSGGGSSPNARFPPPPPRSSVPPTTMPDVASEPGSGGGSAVRNPYSHHYLQNALRQARDQRLAQAAAELHGAAAGDFEEVDAAQFGLVHDDDDSDDTDDTDGRRKSTGSSVDTDAAHDAGHRRYGSVIIDDDESGDDSSDDSSDQWPCRGGGASGNGGVPRDAFHVHYTVAEPRAGSDDGGGRSWRVHFSAHHAAVFDDEDEDDVQVDVRGPDMGEKGGVMGGDVRGDVREVSTDSGFADVTSARAAEEEDEEELQFEPTFEMAERALHELHTTRRSAEVFRGLATIPLQPPQPAFADRLVHLRAQREALLREHDEAAAACELQQQRHERACRQGSDEPAALSRLVEQLGAATGHFAAVAERKAQLAAKEQRLRERVAVMQRMYAELEEKRRSLNRREGELVARRSRHVRRLDDLAARERQHRDQEAAAAEREAALREQEQHFQRWIEILRNREQRAAEKERAFGEQRAAFEGHVRAALRTATANAAAGGSCEKENAPRAGAGGARCGAAAAARPHETIIREDDDDDDVEGEEDVLNKENGAGDGGITLTT